ncbi:SBBP repeat-containing protein [Longitalea arenae]|uniref:SBBP repeat-containing protein n=1 Tax=Longitalea arenae TaxID=2812558 RepID=UPI0019686D41|nr:SBBP repeat-containing protein [Longitalea arenae]
MKRILLFGKSILPACLLFTCTLGFAQVTQKWVKRENGVGNVRDQPTGMVVDHKGNVIVTGYGDGSGANANFTTIKYDDDGDLKWIRRYNGPGNGSDIATAIATDCSGNVYVTGSSWGNGTSSDYTTIKYAGNGDTLWVRRFNTQGNGEDQAFAMAVDDDEHVYVTGITGADHWSIGDITTVKYDNDGDTLWVRSYNGAVNGRDEPAAIAVDKQGNVYVAGYTYGSGTYADYITIKYNANGDQQWINTYDGPVNHHDRAKALAVDDNGNVYVTGFITTVVNEWANYSNVATIKYNAAGHQQWVTFYDNKDHDEPNAMAVDGSGNVYITGLTGTVDEDDDNDYLTIKYNTAGVQLWASIYKSPGRDYSAWATDLMLDAAGNVYITGGLSIWEAIDYVTVKYNTNGEQQWAAIFDGLNNRDRAMAIGMDAAGNIYVTGQSTEDYTTVKYNANGVQQWVTRHNGQNDVEKGGNDGAAALALDEDGNVHVTGHITLHETGTDYGTYKYDPDGNVRWEKTYNGTAFNYDFAQAIATDGDGNVYVTGISVAPGTGEDYATVKYGKNGNTKWIKRYNGPGNYLDHGYALAVDPHGNVYVTGRSCSGTTVNATEDYATIKYDKNGNELWVRRYNGPANNRDWASAIAVDHVGNVYVTGLSTGIGSGLDYTTIKYDANGNQLWVARYNGPADADDSPVALVLDAAGNVYITGTSYGDGADYATIKYNAAGVQQWVARYAAAAGSTDRATDIAVDASGNVYVTGDSNGNTDPSDFGTGDYTTIKYDANGIELWVARYDGFHNIDYANALALDAQGNVYVTGASRGNLQYEDYATVKYNAAGVQQWVARYNGPYTGGNYHSNFTDVANDIAVDGNGHVYVTGYTVGEGTLLDYTTIKYEQTPVLTRSALQPAEQVSAKLNVKAFPNAFTEYINLQWSGSDKPVTITITDMLGKLVEKRTGLASGGNLRTGYHFSPGIYFAEIVQGAEKLVIKLIKK